MNDVSTSQAAVVLEAQPFSILLGARLLVFEAGSACIGLAVDVRLRQQHGFVHGGVLAYLADNAMTFAAGSVLGDAVTVEMKVNYLRPAIGDGDLVAEASVVGAGKSQAVCRCEVYMNEGTKRTLCAAAQGTIRRVEPRPVS